MTARTTDSGLKPARHGLKPPGSGAQHPHVQRHWSLYADWCEATGREPMPADAETLDAFVRQCPASKALTVRRLDAIRVMHDREGVPFAPLGDNDVPLPWRRGQGWLELPQALACVPTVGWVRGFTGRRDGFILVAAGELRLSRNRIRRLTAGDIEAGSRHTAVLGTVISRSDEPGECPACAVTRWLDVLGRWERDWRGGVRQYLALAQPSALHACDVPPTPGWENAETLIPGIDRYGWTSAGLALSIRAISAVLATRQNPELAPIYRDEPPVPEVGIERSVREERGVRVRKEPGEYKRERFDDLSELMDALDEKVAAALKESERILAEERGD